jgi:hypothetical protein
MNQQWMFRVLMAGLSFLLLARAWILLTPTIALADVAFFALMTCAMVAMLKVREPRGDADIAKLNDAIAAIEKRETELRDKVAVLDLKVSMGARGGQSR